MKKDAKNWFKATAIIYWLVYFCRVFVEWRFTNPFQWIVDIPDATNDHRALVLTLLFVYAIIFILFIAIREDVRKTNAKNEQK